MIKLYKISLQVSLWIAIIGAMFRIMHFRGGMFLFYIASIISLIFLVIGLFEIYKTESKTIIDKLLWTIGFLIFPWIIGLVYYYREMKPKYKVL
ncbi:MAG: hypothetical protein PHV20_08725 [Bacteroidales bacterium]|nr:hypothetical protein [Bacteroidales bacterium]